MGWRKTRKVFLSEEEVEAMQALSFILDAEADNVDEVAPDAPASEISQITVQAIPTIGEMLRAIAGWIRELVNKVSAR